MLSAGAVLENPVSGEWAKVLATARDTGGELQRAEAVFRPGAFPTSSFAHLHGRQEEHFEA